MSSIKFVVSNFKISYAKAKQVKKECENQLDDSIDIWTKVGLHLMFGKENFVINYGSARLRIILTQYIKLYSREIIMKAISKYYSNLEYTSMSASTPKKLHHALNSSTNAICKYIRYKFDYEPMSLLGIFNEIYMLKCLKGNNLPHTNDSNWSSFFGNLKSEDPRFGELKDKSEIFRYYAKTLTPLLYRNIELLKSTLNIDNLKVEKTSKYKIEGVFTPDAVISAGGNLYILEIKSSTKQVENGSIQAFFDLCKFNRNGIFNVSGAVCISTYSNPMCCLYSM